MQTKHYVLRFAYFTFKLQQIAQLYTYFLFSRSNTPGPPTTVKKQAPFPDPSSSARVHRPTFPEFSFPHGSRRKVQVLRGLQLVTSKTPKSRWWQLVCSADADIPLPQSATLVIPP